MKGWTLLNFRDGGEGGRRGEEGMEGGGGRSAGECAIKKVKLVGGGFPVRNQGRFLLGSQRDVTGWSYAVQCVTFFA